MPLTRARREPDADASEQAPSDTRQVTDRNVLGGELEPCGADPLTGFYRDGCCRTGPEDQGSHTICAVVTAEFLEHQQLIGNDLITPLPEYRFPGLAPGDRWCVTAVNWLRAHEDGAGAFVVLAPTSEHSRSCRSPRVASTPSTCHTLRGRSGSEHRELAGMGRALMAPADGAAQPALSSA